MSRARRRVHRPNEPRNRETAAAAEGQATSGGPSRLVPWLLGLLAAIGLVVSVALVLPVTDQAMLNAAGGPATTIGRVAGLAGTYLLLITLLLIGRIPLIEHVVGQDKLVRVHRWFGPAILALLGAHVVALTAGYAQQVQTGPLHEFWVMIISYPGMLMAATALGLLIMVAASSYRSGAPEDALRDLVDRPPLRLHRRGALIHAPAQQRSAVHRPPHRPRLLDRPVGVHGRRRHLLPLGGADHPQSLPPAPGRGRRGRGARRHLGDHERASHRSSAGDGGAIPAVALPEPRHVVDGTPLLALRPARRGQGAHHRQAARPPQHVGRRPAAGDARCHRGPLWRLHAPGSAH